MSGLSPRPRTVLAMTPNVLGRVFGADGIERLAAIADLDPELIVTDVHAPACAYRLHDAEVLFTHWGAPQLDERALDRLPKLRAVVHAAGSVKNVLTEACWERDLRVSSAAWANALPVAEYTVAAILWSNKPILRIREQFRAERRGIDWHASYPGAGNYRRVVGVVGASRIGLRVIGLLRPYDLDVLVYDPFLSSGQATSLGARKVELDELCATSDVVTLHAPQIPQTRHMIDRRRLALMRDGATLINTARGSLVADAALEAELRSGRINAVLDVTEPEVLPADSPLYDLPNVLLTPHVAGSLGVEMDRLLDSALGELARYAAGLPFAYPVERAELAQSA